MLAAEQKKEQNHRGALYQSTHPAAAPVERVNSLNREAPHVCSQPAHDALDKTMMSFPKTLVDKQHINHRSHTQTGETVTGELSAGC